MFIKYVSIHTNIRKLCYNITIYSICLYALCPHVVLERAYIFILHRGNIAGVFLIF